MKIGFLQYNNPFHLDFGATKVLGCDIRLGAIESMVRQGHEVTILSPMPVSHEHMLTPQRSPTIPWIDYSFLNGVKWEWVQDKGLDLDMLYINYGPTNTNFAYTAPNEDYRELYGPKTPYMHRTMSVVENFEGPVVYFQNDHLPVPNGEVDYGLPLHQVSKYNLRNVVGRFHPFVNKQWMILTTAFDIPKFREENSSRRYMYHEKPYKFKYVPLMYSPNIFPQQLPAEDPMFDLLYVGAEGDKNRNERLGNLMRAEGFRRAVVGEWGDEARSRWFSGSGVEFHPRVAQGEVSPLLHESLASVQVLKGMFQKYGMMTMRAIEVIRSGSILLCDGMIPGYRDYVDDTFAVFNRSDMTEQLARLQKMSYEDRVAASRVQNERLKTWDSLNWDDLFVEVVG